LIILILSNLNVYAFLINLVLIQSDPLPTDKSRYNIKNIQNWSRMFRKTAGCQPFISWITSMLLRLQYLNFLFLALFLPRYLAFSVFENVAISFID
jgi:hypothetical protein